MPSVGGGEQARADATLRSVGLEPADGRAAAGIDLFAQALERIVGRQGAPLALIVDFASRMVVRQDVLSAPEHIAFTRALMLSHQARARPVGNPPRPFFNTILWIVEKEGDVPDWLLVSNPRIRHIPLARPDPAARRALGRSALRMLARSAEAAPGELDTALDELVMARTASSFQI